MDPREQIQAALRDEPAVLFALLFGSRAGLHARADSDWDVAVYLHDDLDSRTRFDLRRRLAAALEPALAMDLIVLNDAPPLLGHRALRGERLLIRDRTAWVRYFVRTLALALDEEPWRRLHRMALQGRLREGRFAHGASHPAATPRG